MIEKEKEKDLLRRVRGTAAAGFALVFLGVFLGAAPAAQATLVVFEDGRHIRVASYEVVDGDRLTVGLHGGGSMTIPLDVVERIVDEEYERPAPAKPEDAGPIAAEPPAGTGRSVRAFSENLSLLFSSLSPLYSSHIFAAAKEHKVDPSFIAAVIKVESNGHAYAVSRKGARGLMQLMPATARRLGVRSPFDPRDNIRGGVAYLAELAERFGETNADLILAAYNAGENAVEEYGGVPPYRETRDYVKRVLALWGPLPQGARAAL
ncbi:MAG: lytic transglycosylase domain-containing protein [Thermoanaerobaculia bacterium]|nr:lytic transglycosylase domain-containing protein [Thermoanaerobaculia bacterium]